MTENLDGLPERVDLIERKLDSLSSSVDRRFDEVNKRFDEVDKRFGEVSESFVEQRQYSEFLCERLRREMVAGFGRLEGAIRVGADSTERLERKLDQFIDSQSAAISRGRSTRKPKAR